MYRGFFENKNNKTYLTGEKKDIKESIDNISLPDEGVLNLSFKTYLVQMPAKPVYKISANLGSLGALDLIGKAFICEGLCPKDQVFRFGFENPDQSFDWDENEFTNEQLVKIKQFDCVQPAEFAVKSIVVEKGLIKICFDSSKKNKILQCLNNLGLETSALQTSFTIKL